MRVVKMPKIVQSLLYLIGYSREDICEPRTNQLSWKKARDFITHEMPQKMKDYQPLAVVDIAVPAYKTLNFVEKVLSAYQEEEVAAYHPGFLKLFKWLKVAIETRKAAIVRSKAT